ncbi:MAG: hypothetical protein JWN40_2748 [Phycisphaerales bacterium]|nr:hypothetical protein [Phycisphaerales bacterium]
MSTVPVRADSAGSAGSFWRKPFVQDVLPLLTSLMLHVGLIAIGLITYKAVRVMIDVSKVPTVIPESATPITLDAPTIPQFRGLADDPTRRAEQDKIPDVPESATGLSDKRSVVLTLTASGGGAGDNIDDAIALGLSKGFGAGKEGVGIGKQAGVGPGTEGGPGLAPFGIMGGGGNVDFIIPGQRANRVIFLCDSSGSMMNKFDTLRQELRKAVDRLKGGQAFDIIFFSADRYVTLDNQLLLALPEAKRKAYDFLDKTAPYDSSDPIPGLRAAFATKPELIYMLTDGDFPNNAQVLAEIRTLNKDPKVKINTIAFMDRGEEYEKLLKQIAEENGGTFKFVAEQDLQK